MAGVIDLQAVQAHAEFSREAASVLSAISDDRDRYYFMRGALRQAQTFEQLPPRAQQIWREALAGEGRKARVSVRPYIREGRPVAGYVREQDLVEQLLKKPLRLLSEEQVQNLPEIELRARVAAASERMHRYQSSRSRGYQRAWEIQRQGQAEMKRRGIPISWGIESLAAFYGPPPEEPLDLLRGSPHKSGKGRKGLKRPREGWLEYAVNEHNASMPLRQDMLMGQRVAAMQGDAAWHEVEDESGQVVGVQRGNLRLVDLGPPGYEVFEGDRSVGIGNGRTYDEIVASVAPRLSTPGLAVPGQQFLDEWWSSPGRPGRYQTMSGDPGTAFEEQHQRIMEVGARLDAELAYQTRKEEKAYRDVRRHYDRLDREIKKAVKARDDEHYRLAADRLIEQGWTSERATPRTVKRLVAKWHSERAKGPSSTLAGEVWDAYFAFTHVATDPRLIELNNRRNEVWGQRYLAEKNDGVLPADRLREARDAYINARRDAAYNILSQIRPFGTARIEYEPWSATASAALFQAQFWVPTDWVADSNAAQKDGKNYLIVRWSEDRGRYEDRYVVADEPQVPYSAILISPSKSPQVKAWLPQDAPRGVGTAVHELVHRSEHVRDGIKGAEWTFYTSRVSPSKNAKWEETVGLRELTGVQSYKPDEKTRRDDFIDAYSGKTYGDEMTSSYEILSMGVEDLVTGQHDILTDDEEYRQFVLGSLAYL